MTHHYQSKLYGKANFSPHDGAGGILKCSWGGHTDQDIHNWMDFRYKRVNPLPAIKRRRSKGAIYTSDAYGKAEFKIPSEGVIYCNSSGRTSQEIHNYLRVKPRRMRAAVARQRAKNPLKRKHTRRILKPQRRRGRGTRTRGRVSFWPPGQKGPINCTSTDRTSEEISNLVSLKEQKKMAAILKSEIRAAAATAQRTATRAATQRIEALEAAEVAATAAQKAAADAQKAAARATSQRRVLVPRPLIRQLSGPSNQSAVSAKRAVATAAKQASVATKQVTTSAEQAVKKLKAKIKEAVSAASTRIEEQPSVSNSALDKLGDAALGLGVAVTGDVTKAANLGIQTMKKDIDKIATTTATSIKEASQAAAGAATTLMSNLAKRVKEWTPTAFPAAGAEGSGEAIDDMDNRAVLGTAAVAAGGGRRRSYTRRRYYRGRHTRRYRKKKAGHSRVRRKYR